MTYTSPQWQLSVNGAAFVSPLAFFLPPLVPTEVFVTARRGPFAFEYRDMPLVLVSECENELLQAVSSSGGACSA